MSNTISRLEKLERLQNPYPNNFYGRQTIKYVLNYYESSISPEESGNWEGHVEIEDNPPGKKSWKIVGRISARRDHGYNIFFDIFDQTGSIQLYAQFAPTNSGANLWDLISECDIGDMVGVEGTLGRNPRGEPLLLISNFTLLAKALREPPDKQNGLKSPEARCRHREQDLMSSAETRELFKTRARIIFELRKYLNERDFIELETPVLQPIYGGATARPFITKHNSLGQDYFLSISSELYLKRALVGGFDRVYSFSRCFRNEGISPNHQPEFTNLEIFESCKNAYDMQVFTDELLNYVAYSVGSSIPPPVEFRSDLLSSDWPLSRKQPENKKYAEAWELYIDDMEIASGASDLNDPREQEKRLKESEKKAYLPDIFPYDPYDKNYIEALEMGALPWAGVGIGIDRLCMLLLGKKNIKEVIMFPTLRSEK